MSHLDPADVAAERPTRARYVVLAALCLAAAIAYLPRNSLSVAESTVREELQLTREEMSWILAAFFITYAIFQLPTGWLCHRWGSRLVLPAVAALWSLGSALMGAAGGFTGLFVNRLAQGAAQAGVFPCAAVVIARWFPLSQRTLASGALGAFMSVGGVIGSALTGKLLGVMQWEWVYLVYAVPGFLWAAWFYWWFRDRPEEHAGVNKLELAAIGGARPETPVVAREPIPWAGILSSPATWWISGQQFFRAAGYSFFATWFATYLQEAHNTSIKDSGYLNSLPLLAVVLGSLAGGAVSDWVQVRTGSRQLSRRGLSAASLLGCAVCIAISFWLNNVVLAVLVISAGSFLSGIGGATAYAITMDMGGRHVATVFSMMNMTGNIGGAVFPLLVPPLVGWAGSWDPVIIAFAGIYVAASACWMLLRPEGTVFDQSWVRTVRS